MPCVELTCFVDEECTNNFNTIQDCDVKFDLLPKLTPAHWQLAIYQLDILQCM
jgi:hypothetical protein